MKFHSLLLTNASQLTRPAILCQLGLKTWDEYDKIVWLMIRSTVGLPELPKRLIRLDCPYCQLTALPLLPDTLISLDCSNNQLDDLGTLPPNLRTLACHQNNLKSLIIPTGLVRLYCAQNLLKSLSPLPYCLEELYCASNRLTRLPTLPERLIQLDYYDNPMAEFPKDTVWPDTLLSVRGENISQLLLIQHNNRLAALGLERVETLPDLDTRLEIKKRYDIERFRLDGLEYQAAIGEIKQLQER